MKTDSNPSKLNLKKSKTKKIHRVESNHDLSLFKFKSSAVVTLTLFGLLNSLFEGKAVTKLPFVPARIVQKMSHKVLQGNDRTDYSMVWDIRRKMQIHALSGHENTVCSVFTRPTSYFD
ncbi:hypothetical protein LOK49_LG09G01090 [Camellia lanceoleosa]|uniref:Uncharacterized protein n=1 Tax=Camellia lanceoleosa TaxID=1840588 RepID=A0ACC0GRC8_9ERIC|nr:hypothetical protein LOK49_LG09G01090 [Camellia lanceoleosa]